MDHVANISRRCADMVDFINQDESWELSEADAKTLAEIATIYVSPISSDAQCRTVIVNIRRDHSTIEALCRNSHMGHQAAWVSWLSHAMAILRHAHLDWARDGAVHIDDLAQIAMLELVRALPGFRYQSRFSTWAFQVITRGVQRHLRDMSAQKRVGNIDATVDPLTVAGAISEGEIPEAQAEAHLLTAIIDAELTAALGVRNAEVFRLWACDDLSAEMIGQRVGLSVARVYAVIAQSRQYLRGREVIRGWGDASEYV